MLHHFTDADGLPCRAIANHERDRSGGFLTVYRLSDLIGTTSWYDGAMRVHWSPRLMLLRTELDRIIAIEIERAASGAPIFASSPTLTCMGGLT